MLYYGRIGYVDTHPDPEHPSTWVEGFSWRYYPGEILSVNHRWQNNTDSVNGDLNVTNKISIIADPYMTQNAHAIKYAELFGHAWNVESIEFALPRIILSVGGVANVVLQN